MEILKVAGSIGIFILVIFAIIVCGDDDDPRDSYKNYKYWQG